jgi:hydroxymethylglutaryl-CoA lyase
MSDLPNFVHVTEVGPRDGLQIEPRILSAEQKIQMVEALVGCGIKEVEVGSFVNPKAVPQMADTNEVFDKLSKRDGVDYRALWLNLKGLERAIDHGRVDVDGKLTLTASETFVQRNTNRSIEQTLAEMPVWIRRYQDAGIKANSLGVMAALSSIAGSTHF